MNSDKIYDLVGKYFAGEVSDEEKAEVLSWINSSDENVKEFELHKHSWEECRIKFDAPNSEVVFKNVLNKIDDHQEHEISNFQKTEKGRSRFSISTISRIAASIIIIITLIYFISTNIEIQHPELKSIALVSKVNPSGQKSKIFLPDGSEVWLNAESQISYQEKFSDSIRIVSLVGEAFFNVVKNPDQPFIVRAGEVSTTALGTSFNVQAFENESTTYIALESGKVKIEIDNEHGNQEIFLDSGEGISYDRSSHITVKEMFDREKLLSWKDGTIWFKDADLEEIVSTLSRWYGVQIEVKNKKSETWAYEGPFTDETLDNVLKGISFTKPITYEFVNPKYVIIKLN